MSNTALTYGFECVCSLWFSAINSCPVPARGGQRILAADRPLSQQTPAFLPLPLAPLLPCIASAVRWGTCSTVCSPASAPQRNNRSNNRGPHAARPSAHSSWSARMLLGPRRGVMQSKTVHMGHQNRLRSLPFENGGRSARSTSTPPALQPNATPVVRHRVLGVPRARRCVSAWRAFSTTYVPHLPLPGFYHPPPLALRGLAATTTSSRTACSMRTGPTRKCI